LGSKKRYGTRALEEGDIKDRIVTTNKNVNPGGEKTSVSQHEKKALKKNEPSFLEGWPARKNLPGGASSKKGEENSPLSRGQANEIGVSTERRVLGTMNRQPKKEGIAVPQKKKNTIKKKPSQSPATR